MRHPWPGNVRELENCIERGVLLTQGKIMTPDVLPSTILSSQGEAPAANIDGCDLSVLDKGISLNEMVENYEKLILEAVLERTKGNIAAAARELQSTSRIVSYKVKQYDI